MKTFEERFTAWIDGRLCGPELEDFEKALEDRSAAEAERASALKLRSLLKSHGHAPPLKNVDFFNHHLLTQIDSETEKASRMEPPRKSVWRLIFQPFPWAAVACALLTFVLFKATNPRPGSGLAAFVNSPGTLPEVPYTAEIVSAESTDPDISVTPIHSDADKVTVLWVDGLNYLPVSYRED